MFVLGPPVLALMALKAARTVQERRAARDGYVTFGGDDAYQNRRAHQRNHDAAMLARIRLDVDDAGFEEIAARVRACYPAWFDALRAAIHPAHAPDGFAAPLEEWEEEAPYALRDELLLTKIILCRRDRTILLVGNHVFLGGYLLSHFVQLVYCGRTYDGIFPRNRYLPVLSELTMLAALGQMAWGHRYRPAPVAADWRSTRRYYARAPVESLRAEAGGGRIHEMFLVIAWHVRQVMDALGRDRLRVNLPVSFEDDATFNTVGVVVLDLDRAPDLRAQAERVRTLTRRHRYQASATNHIQRVLPTRHLSERARHRVDLTLTLVPGKTLPDNRIGAAMTEYEFTMQRIEYPVYVMAFVFEGVAHSSFMAASPDFDERPLLADPRVRPMELSL